MTRIEAPRGTHDVLPSDQPLWQKVTGEMERLCALYGYRRIQTPVFEDTELFARTSGAGSDIVQKEMYTFEDRSGRSLTLRPEGTAPICRAYIEHGMKQEPQPVKLYTLATMYRYAAPQRGRFREHNQLSLECIGSADPAVDAEVLQFYDTLLRNLGVTDYELRLNSIGDRNCRPQYVEKLNAWLDAHPEALDDEARQKRATSPLRVFDVKNEKVRAALQDAPKIGDSLCDECAEHFAAVRAYLDAYGVPYTLDPTLVRGLDYYSRTAFEFIGPDESAQASTICGGGRYDYLVEEIGGPPTPGIGFGAGIERLVLSLELEGIAAEEPRLAVFVACEQGQSGLTLVRDLRASGIAADTDYAGRSLKGQIGYGQKRASATVIVAADGVDAAPRGRARHPGSRRRPPEGAAVSWRDTTCGALRAGDAGRRVTLAGWADTRRDHGGLVFVDLRDYSGKIQLVVNPEHAAEAAAIAHEIRNEFVLQAEGEVVRRAADAVNPNLPTGEVEVQVDTLRIVSRSEPLPFQLDEESVDENAAAPLPLARHAHRAHAAQPPAARTRVICAIRRRMDELGFVDVWTPSMTKGTPEGARDFLVPVRLQPGRFFALAQSPQLFKQLSHDRRARPLLPDRHLLARRGSPRRPPVRVPRSSTSRCRSSSARTSSTCSRKRVVASFEAVGARAAGAPVPAPLVARGDALRHRQAGPPLRARDPGRDGDHPRLAVRRLRRTRRPSASSSPRARSRAPSSRGSRRSRRSGGRRASPISSRDESGEVRSPIAKFLSEQELAAFAAEPGSDRRSSPPTSRATSSRACSAACAPISGRELELADTSRNEFLWMIDFPLFERDEDTGRWTFVHHPFTGVKPGQEHLVEADPGRRASASAYDLVWNGMRARLRVDPDPRRRSSSAPSSARWAWARRRRRRSSGSCSTRCRWARRRTAASPWASSGSSCSWPASPTSAR